MSDSKPFDNKSLILVQKWDYSAKTNKAKPLPLYRESISPLTKIEFEIFIFLSENLNKISSREQILNATSLDINTKNRTIDMHISNIRYKIGDDSKNPKYIKSVWGIGYKFVG